MSDLWYDEEFKNVRDKKAKLHKLVIKALESFISEKYIREYRVITEGKSVIGVEIEV